MGTVPTRLREIREAAGINQPQLAERLGVSQQTLSTYERGTRELPMDVLGTLCRIFRISPAEIWIDLGKLPEGFPGTPDTFA